MAQGFNITVLRQPATSALLPPVDQPAAGYRFVYYVLDGEPHRDTRCHSKAATFQLWGFNSPLTTLDWLQEILHAIIYIVSLSSMLRN